MERPGIGSRHDSRHRMGGPSRHRLRLSAVHGAAALRHAGKARHRPARGGRRSRRQADCRLPHHHLAAVAARHRRRLPDGVHSGGRRVRHPRPFRRHRHAHDRQGAVGRVLHQCRLAAGLGGGDLPARPAGWADRAVPTPAGEKPGAKLMTSHRSRFVFTVLAFGYAFLYLPILLVAVYSFNESRLVTVWAGFSTKWWGALFANEAMLSAAWLSLQIGVVSATIASLLGLAAGYV